MTLDKLVTKYKNFVENYAKRIYEKEKFPLMPLEDITQCAYIGLIRAYNKNEYESGNYTEQQFKNYVEFYMHQEIDKGYREFRNIVHYPDNYIQLIRKIRRVMEEDESIDYISKKLDYPKEAIREAIKISYLFDDILLYEDRLGNSMNIPLLIGDIKYEGKYNEDLAIRNVFSNEIRTIIFEKAKLTDREKKILTHRYFEKDNIVNLEDVAKIFNVTRERVRQIEHKAFRKIRKVIRYKDLL